MFLMTVGHNLRNFLIQYIFQPRETANSYFRTVLYALAIFSNEVIKRPHFEETLSEA